MQIVIETGHSDFVRSFIHIINKSGNQKKRTSVKKVHEKTRKSNTPKASPNNKQSEKTKKLRPEQQAPRQRPEFAN